jgi:excisionase family DNA binding protein
VERLLTVRQVAARLHACRATIYSMVERGDLPHIRIGNAVRFAPSDLVAALERHRRK